MSHYIILTVWYTSKIIEASTVSKLTLTSSVDEARYLVLTQSPAGSYDKLNIFNLTILIN